MFVRTKTGARAGELQEMAYDVGRQLVDSGRAEEVFFDDRAKAKPQPIAEPTLEVDLLPTPKGSVRKKRKR